MQKQIQSSLLPVFVSTLWISVSEFVRNQFLLHQHWVDYYAELGLRFPESPVNGAVWGLWSLCYAALIFVLSKKFNQTQTMLLSWGVGFGMMWLVIGNLGVLPYSILWMAIPLSIVEVWGAVKIVTFNQAQHS